MPDLDIDSAVAEIASGIFDKVESPEPVLEDTEQEPEENLETKPETQETPQETPRTAPKSWAKEQHEYWSKIDPKAQEYIELREKQMLDGIEQYKSDASFAKQIKEIAAPYKALLTSQGVDELKAVQYFMNAHYKLSTLPPAERNAYFANLGRTFGVDLSAMQTTQENIDPNVRALQEQLAALQNNLTAREQSSLNETKSRVSKEVEAFAIANPYFDEVANDIVAMINAGFELKDAYEKAIWANPVTRQKELARIQTESETKLREKAKQEADAARKAASTNVRGRDTKIAPTEPLGKMEDTMRETLKSIRSRTQ